MMKLWSPIILALIALTAALFASCQSLPLGVRIGVRTALDASAECIRGDDEAATKRERIARCASAIMVEAADALDDLPDPPPPAPAPGRAIESEAAPPVDPPDASPDDAAPGSTAWRAPPASWIAPAPRPARGWPYRYRRG